MKINHDVLVKLLDEAFTAGQNVSHELKEQTIEDIILAVQKGQVNPLMVVPFAELCSLPTGRKIFHSIFGEGIINIKKRFDPACTERFVQFAGFRMLLKEGWPWTEELQIMG